MKKLYRCFTVVLMLIGMIVLAQGKIYADQKSDDETVRTCIRVFCEKMYGSMLADSTTSFSKEDFLSIDGYLTAKVFEAKRAYEQIDVPGGFTMVEISDVIIKEQTQTREGYDRVTARIKCNYISGGDPSYWGSDFQFTLGMVRQQLTVLDVRALEGDEFLNVSESLYLWKDECSYAGEDWEYEAVDRILANKMFDVRDMIDITEIEPEPEDPNLRNNHDSASNRTTYSYSAANAGTYAYTTSTNPYDPENYIFCVAYDSNGNEKDCTNFVSQCVWAGYGGTSGYTLPATPTYNNATITALRTAILDVALCFYCN